MRMTQFFLPLVKDVTQDAQIASHKLMLKAGMMCQESAGLYAWLPLGLRVLKKVEEIIRQEQNRIGGQEILLPVIQSADLWKQSDRYESYGKEMLRIRDRHDREYLFSPTNEEAVTNIFKRFVKSYRQLPTILYHIQWKFRDEIRPRFGVMRCREFLMKDAYSFDVDAQTARETYFKMMASYLRTFSRMGLTIVPVRADTGPIGGDLSHEFHILAQTGESRLYYDKTFDELHYDDEIDVEKILSLYAMEEGMHDPKICPVSKENLREARGIEVGHIFNFGTKYTEGLEAGVTGKNGEIIYPECGSYGIGLGRLVAGVIEAFHDEHGIIWPESIAPFKVGLINVKESDDTTRLCADDIYKKLQAHGVEVLYDDTQESPGVKFNRMDLIGLPWQVIVGPRDWQEGKVEIKNRKTGAREKMSPAELYQKFL